MAIKAASNSNLLGTKSNSFSKVLAAPEPGAPGSVEYLVIAGGGGGGSVWGGGGGAGGYQIAFSGDVSGANTTNKSKLFVSAGTSYTVTVGAGGSPNTNGNNSVLHSITSIGGGAGREIQVAGQSGGSGGGGGARRVNGGSGTANQGYGGGSTHYPVSHDLTIAAGGGGAGSVGVNAVGFGFANGDPGDGGAGLSSSITGSSVGRAGGGGGGNRDGEGGRVGYASSGGGQGAASNGVAGSAGTANTGGGGGGASASGGGNGGSGVVIIRFGSAYDSPTVSAGLTFTETIVDGDKIIQFTAGTGTMTW